MRFNSGLAYRYRKNGHIVVARDPKTEYYDVFIQYKDKKFFIEMVKNKAVGIKIAKNKAMEFRMGFDEEIDVYY